MFPHKRVARKLQLLRIYSQELKETGNHAFLDNARKSRISFIVNALNDGRLQPTKSIN